MNRFIGKIVFKSEQFFDNVKKAVHINHQNKGVDRMPSIAKKRLLRKTYEKQMLISSETTKSTESSGSVLADRIEQLNLSMFCGWSW